MSTADSFQRLIKHIADSLELELTPDQQVLMLSHYLLLEKWRRGVSLTSIEGLEAVCYRHFGESLAVARVIGPGTGTVLDVGSGAGFPGMVVAVCSPARRVTLLEPVGKKWVFLKEVARKLPNVEVRQTRIADYTERSHWITMRGLSADTYLREVRRVSELAAFLLTRAQAERLAESGSGEHQIHHLPWDEGRVILTIRFT
jgi:16S rRNA (guanine(527)-N(7))-methyltransferase RsmG